MTEVAQDAPQKVRYKVVTVSFKGRNYHQSYDNPDAAFYAFENKKLSPMILFVSIHRDGQVLLTDMKDVNPA